MDQRESLSIFKEDEIVELIKAKCSDIGIELKEHMLSKFKDYCNTKCKNRIVDLISNIDYIILDNKYMYQIMGYLLYALINYEIYKIEDLDKFIGREEQTLINIAKVIKYIIM